MMTASGAAVSRNIGRLTANNSILFLCDMQEKFRNNIQYFPQIVANAARVLQAFKILGLPVLCTEQYPKGLGPTVAELELEKHNITAVSKTQFSMCVNEVAAQLDEQKGRSHVVVCGIESHVCVQQTVLELLQRGASVHVVADAVSSRAMTDRLVSLRRMRDSGAFVTTSEAVILGLAGGSHHPRFKELQAIIRESAQDTGLLAHLNL